MNRLRVFTLLGLVALIVLVGLLTAVSTARAQSGGGYDLTWNTVDGGGGISTGGGYTLAGTIGQADAGAQSGGAYTVAGGYWSGLLESLYALFIPVVTR